MRFGLLGWIASDLSDVDATMLADAATTGIDCMGAHITRPANEIDPVVAERAAEAIATSPIEVIQLWGPYGRIIDADKAVRSTGVAGAIDVVRLAAQMGLPASGIRPTSHNQRGDWWPHPKNHSAQSEELLVRSISEVLEVAVALGVRLVLETHQTTTLDSAERIARVIERTDPAWVKVNIDPANFVSSLAVAYDPQPMIDELFDTLGAYAASVHTKDVCFEDRFVLHIAECVPGTGIMDIDHVLRRAALLDDIPVCAEHLPPSDLRVAVAHLIGRAKSLGLTG